MDPLKSIGPGLLSLCIKTALYRRLGRDESPTVDSVCVRAHIDGSGESQTIGRACVRAHLRYGVSPTVGCGCVRTSRMERWESYGQLRLYACVSVWLAGILLPSVLFFLAIAVNKYSAGFIGNRLVPIVVNLRTLLIINNNLLPIKYFGNYFAYRKIFGIGHISIAITSDFRIVTN